jgi:hypothetical protein
VSRGTEQSTIRQDTAGWKGKINNGLAHETKFLNIHSNIKLQYLIKQDEKSLLNETELRMILLVLYKQFLNIHSKKKKSMLPRANM